MLLAVKSESNRVFGDSSICLSRRIKHDHASMPFVWHDGVVLQDGRLQLVQLVLRLAFNHRHTRCGAVFTCIYGRLG